MSASGQSDCGVRTPTRNLAEERTTLQGNDKTAHSDPNSQYSPAVDSSKLKRQHKCRRINPLPPEITKLFFYCVVAKKCAVTQTERRQQCLLSPGATGSLQHLQTVRNDPRGICDHAGSRSMPVTVPPCRQMWTTVESGIIFSLVTCLCRVLYHKEELTLRTPQRENSSEI